VAFSAPLAFRGAAFFATAFPARARVLSPSEPARALFAPAPARVLLTAAFFATLFAAAPTAFTALAATPLPEDPDDEDDAAAPADTPRVLFFPPASLASPPEARAWLDRPDADCCTAVFFATMPRPLHIL
jgi:hypothetical protein